MQHKAWTYHAFKKATLDRPWNNHVPMHCHVIGKITNITHCNRWHDHPMPYSTNHNKTKPLSWQVIYKHKFFMQTAQFSHTFVATNSWTQKCKSYTGNGSWTCDWEIKKKVTQNKIIHCLGKSMPLWTWRMLRV